MMNYKTIEMQPYKRIAATLWPGCEGAAAYCRGLENPGGLQPPHRELYDFVNPDARQL